MGLNVRGRGEEVKKTRGLLVNKSEKREAIEDDHEVLGLITQEMRKREMVDMSRTDSKQSRRTCPGLILEILCELGQTHFNLVSIFTLCKMLVAEGR